MIHKSQQSSSTAVLPDDWESKCKEILSRYWGFDSFRGIQTDIINSIARGRDTLGLMPTGGGKSITFQVPALLKEGVCVVITPLTALMKDQVISLRKRGIKATAVHSDMSHNEILTALDNCVFGAIKILYVSPERLSTPLFQTKFRHMKVSFITVDEAHCISQWGYDFRPSYLHIADVRKIHPEIPVLALTATATPFVIEDIQERLGFSEHCVFKMSFERKNLSYVVRDVMDKYDELFHILQCVEGSAVVYVRSRRKSKELADMLCSHGFSATYYNAGIDAPVKDDRQKAWLTDEVRIIVATNAFGMGIDKPDVRIVIHFDCPDSVEAYFQEAGRAGRDGKKAYAVLLWNDGDRRKLNKRIADNFPEKDYIKDVYEHLAYYYQIAVGDGYNMSFEFSLGKFCAIYNYYPLHVDSALKILTRAGYIDYSEEQDNSSRVLFTVNRDDLYRLKNNSEAEDKIIVVMLRKYGGIFCDYRFIDESFIAHETGLSRHEVYLALKQLASKNIISYIPGKCTPIIRFCQRREDVRNMIISQEVYEKRKKQYCKRLDAMFFYATAKGICRNRILLDYFGERSTHDCGMCDICLNRNNEIVNEKTLKNAQSEILALLADGKKHYLTELKGIKLPTELIDAALKDLLNDEILFMDEGLIFKA